VPVGDTLEAVADVESFVAGMDRAAFATGRRTVHACFDVDLDVVWTAATVDLPEVARRPRAHALRFAPPPA
jgi:uncharacterized protein with HEPN domain